MVVAEKVTFSTVWDGDYRGLHPGISPVNSFRLIFDQYFGAGYGLLPNQGYLGFLPDLTAVPEK